MHNVELFYMRIITVFHLINAAREGRREGRRREGSGKRGREQRVKKGREGRREGRRREEVGGWERGRRERRENSRAGH